MKGGASVKRIVDFLEFLADNPAEELKFEEAPDQSMEAFGLDADQRDLIMNGGIGELRGRISDEIGSRVYVIRIKMAP